MKKQAKEDLIALLQMAAISILTVLVIRLMFRYVFNLG